MSTPGVDGRQHLAQVVHQLLGGLAGRPGLRDDGQQGGVAVGVRHGRGHHRRHRRGRRWTRRPGAAWAVASEPSNRMVSGPLKPGPKPSASNCSASAWVVPSAGVGTRVVCIEKNGIAMMPRVTVATRTASTLCLVTVSTQPLVEAASRWRRASHRPGPSGRSGACGAGPAAQEAEHGRHQGERDQHGDDDGGGGGQAHLGEERDARDEQEDQRDDDGEPGGHDRRPGGADGVPIAVRTSAPRCNSCRYRVMMNSA